jgi:prepilin-type N-terminal cleavage/methylation domain-containing protein
MLKTRGKISGWARAVDVEDLTHISHKYIESRLCVVSGFTLIELLVVISIIMLLTITAVANFSYVQERMRLDFAADTLVSSLREGLTETTVNNEEELLNVLEFGLKFSDAVLNLLLGHVVQGFDRVVAAQPSDVGVCFFDEVIHRLALVFG